MKKPRVTDFDPNAKAPKLASPLENMPAIEKPPSPKRHPSPAPQEASPLTASEPDAIPALTRTPVPPHVLPSVRTPVRRTITRYAFEFFQDQVESLRRFALEEKTRGEKGSMSAMIRQAVDAYIAKRNRVDQ